MTVSINVFYINFFLFFKLLFNIFFFKVTHATSSFFFFFFPSLLSSLFLHKIIFLKKQFIYNYGTRPVYAAKALVTFSKVSAVSQQDELLSPAFFSKKKFRQRVFSIQKTFSTFKRVSLKKFFFFYKFKFLRRRNLFNFFSNFRKANFSELENFFSLNLLCVLHTVFPFFNFFLLKKLVHRGCVLLNCKKVAGFFTPLRVGDFLSIFFIKELWPLFFKHMQQQQKYFFKMKRKLFMISHAHLYGFEKTVSSYFSPNFSQFTFFFKKIPTWAEVDFLSFSIFLIKKKRLHSYFFFFNPYLYRLLEFK